MSNKIRIIVAVLCLAIAIYLGMTDETQHNTDPAESMRILTNVYMKLDFTEAKRIGVEHSDSHIDYKNEYAREKERLFRRVVGVFSAYLSSSQMQSLVDAHLEMDRKRNVQTEILSQAGDTARVKVTIAAIDNKAVSDKMVAAIKNFKQPQMTQEEVALLIRDALADVYRTTEPIAKTVSFEVDCEKKQLSSHRFGKAAIFELLFTGEYWLPANMATFHENLDAVVFGAA